MAASTPLPKSVGVGQDWGPGRWGVVGWAAGDEEGKIGRDCRTETGTETETQKQGDTAEKGAIHRPRERERCREADRQESGESKINRERRRARHRDTERRG